MSGLVPAAVAWPLLATLLLAVPVPRLGAAAVARIGLAASLLTLLLTLLDLVSPLGSAGRWLVDRLALSNELLVALPGVLAGLLALVATGDSREAARPVPGARERSMAIQLATGGAIGACRADPLFLMLAGFGLMLAGASLLLPRRPGPALPFAGLLLVAWLGVAWLSAASGVPARWSALAQAVAPGAVTAAGFGLLLLPMLLLAWLGPACCLEAPARDAALLPLLLAVPALGTALRLRGLPGTWLPQAGRLALCGAGVLAVGLCCLLALTRRGLADRVVLAASLQLGLVAIGFGVGGTGGIVAGFMILGALGLLLPVALLPAATAQRVRPHRVAVLALAAMPPFGLFAADFVLLLRLFATTPLLALLALAGVAAAGLSLLDALRREPPAAGVPGGSRGAAGVLRAVPALVLLAVAGWLGVAMPATLSDWLLGLSEAAAGAAASAAGAPR